MNDIVERYHYDESGDKLIIERTQDVSPVLQQIKLERETIKEVPGLGFKVGTIPGIIIEQYMKEHGVSYRDFIADDTHIHRIMNNPDYSRFRVWEGRI